jgi:hypothetical protein
VPSGLSTVKSLAEGASIGSPPAGVAIRFIVAAPWPQYVDLPRL